MASTMPIRPSRSIASCRQLRIVSLTRGWSGGSIGPLRFSWHATWSGKTAARRSSERIRRIGAGTFRPPVRRSSARPRVAFHRQRLPNIGEGSTAWIRVSRSVWGRRKANTESSGKLCCSPSDSTTPSSVAVACSSKSKFTQKRFRRERPQARLTRPPNGVWRTSCMPPASSKNRSATTVSTVGTTPRTATVSAM